jgi:hypothetical protein
MSEEAKAFLLAAGESAKTAYEVLGLTVEEISAQQELSIDETRTLLWHVSSKFRKDKKYSDSPNQEDEIMEMYESLARCSPDDGVRERALRFLINERKGRNDIEMRRLELETKSVDNQTVDLAMRLQQFNDNIKRIRTVTQNPNPPVFELSDVK